ncbi:vacuolar protein sorting-associated protein 8 homolog [Culicoides brevitarsis]|uniref:vacuolar protein sorting-associated protein 8 homolog n=1 Tax=Culicoides brevitarsis TaxID=469753 RepID=UPI00307C46A8
MNSLKAGSLQSLVESDRGSNDSFLAESLNLDIEDLDDAEYLIPQVDQMPTLESVLNDLNGDDANFDELFPSSLVPPPATPTPSTTSSDASRPGNASILRLVMLKAVSTQITSAADRIGAGLATCVAVSQTIAVGMSHGHILMFGESQTLKWCCQDFLQDGAVSCLAFNEDDSRLVVGYARGRLVMLDTAKGNVLRSLTDVVAPNTGLLHIKWTDKPNLALCSDTGGSVWSLSFTRRMGIRGCESRCLFSGARGEVCTFEPLLLNDEDHHLRNYTIAALATLSKFFVVMIRPRLRIIKFHPLPGPPESLPLLAWQLVLIQLADSTKTVDPVLATARGNNLFFHQLAFNGGKISLLFLRHIKLQYNLLALHWIGPKSIVLMDELEKLHLTDVRTNKEQDLIDLSNLGLVYSSAQFKGLATGGNVSPAFALAGSYACYNSVVSFGSQLYILGGRNLHVVNARAWSERLAYLTSSQRWDEAIEIAIEGYRNASDKYRRLHVAKERILELIGDYIKATHRSPELYLDAVMSCLIEINETSLLWGELWDRLYTHETYLTLITSHIENDDISTISPAVAQALCDFWCERDASRLEDLILKLDWKCLDLHQVLTISKKARLYRAQIYLNANALCDFTASLVDLIPLINSQPNLGNHLLVYISSCLAGRGYPTGEIPENLVQNVKHDVLRCLTASHSVQSNDNELPYPYMRALLQYSVRETINVLSLAFQEKEFNGDLGLSQRQRIMNILLEVLSPEHSTWSQRSCLLNFIASQISTNSLPEADVFLSVVVPYLTKETIPDETVREHSEREQAWLELLRTKCLPHIPTDHLIELSQVARCHRVTEYLLLEQKRFDEILETYLCDPRRHLEMIHYLFRFASHPERQIYEQILRNFDACLEINPEHVTKLVIEHFKDKIQELSAALTPKSRNLFAFLDTLVREGVVLDPNLHEIYVDLLCIFNSSHVLDFLKSTAETFRLQQVLDICIQHEIKDACVYLYEKCGNFDAAYQLSLETLVPGSNNLEDRANEITGLCTRGSQMLSAAEKEKFWFQWLEVVLNRPDLYGIMKSALHAASAHVDLTNLVQLVLSHSARQGNFGDIKDILVCMLSNSKYEAFSLKKAANILSSDLHVKLEKELQKSRRGLCVKSVKCMVCRKKLKNCENIFVFGSCGHALHDECAEVQQKLLGKMECPRCGQQLEDEAMSVELHKTSNLYLEGVKIVSSMTLDTRAPPYLQNSSNHRS